MIGAEPMAFGNQGFTQGPVIIDFTVEDDRDGIILVPHRLCTTGDIENGQAAMPEKDRAVRVEIETFAVGTAVGERICHADDVGTTASADKACDAAHQRLSVKLN